MDRDRVLPSTFVCSAQCRTPDHWSEVLRSFQLQSAQRYQPEGEPGNRVTFCATAARDIARAAGVFLPDGVYGANAGLGTPFDPPVGFNRMRASDLQDFMQSKDGQAWGWVSTDLAGAQAAARKGCPTFGIYKAPPGQDGHIAAMQVDGTVAQAGALCGYGFTVSQVFGDLPVTWWTHA